MRVSTPWIAPFALLALGACSATSEPSVDEGADAVTMPKQSVDQKARDQKIDDALVGVREMSLERKMTNGWALAGIAKVETQLTHCYDFAQFRACPVAIPGASGPQYLVSPDCGGRPVVAGASDQGGCSQGGIGLFQLDSGTQSKTLAQWKGKGFDILSIEGNTGAAIDLLAEKIAIAINNKRTNSPDPESFLRAIDNPSRSDPAYEIYLGILANGYNGWGWDTPGWIRQKTKYHEGILHVLSLHDLAWWKKKT